MKHALWPESGAISQIPALDGLRALAVLLVLLFHAWSMVPQYVQSGQVPSAYPLWYAKTGVNLFFTLSGFLLFLPYAEWVFGLRPQPATLMFYKRRALRVVPAYWASLLITILIHGAILYDVLLHSVFLSNTTWATTFSINGVYWTMAIEVQFYVALPLIAWSMRWLALRTKPLTAAALTLAGLTLISLMSAYVVSIGGVNLTALPVVGSFILQYAAMPYWLVVFGCGIACSVIYTYLKKVHVAKAHTPYTRQPRTWATGAFIAGIALAVFLSVISAISNTWLGQGLFGVAYAGVLLGVLLGPRLLRRPFELQVLRFVGLISYSFYIWHHAVLVVLAPHLHGWLFRYHTPVLFILGLICTLPVAYVSYLCFERPFMSARKRAHEETLKQAAVA